MSDDDQRHGIRLRTGVAFLSDGRFKASVRLDMGERSELFESEPYDTEAAALGHARLISENVRAFIKARYPNVKIGPMQ